MLQHRSIFNTGPLKASNNNLRLFVYTAPSSHELNKLSIDQHFLNYFVK